jgi:hypothetical protein
LGYWRQSPRFEASQNLKKKRPVDSWDLQVNGPLGSHEVWSGLTESLGGTVGKVDKTKTKKQLSPKVRDSLLVLHSPVNLSSTFGLQGRGNLLYPRDRL